MIVTGEKSWEIRGANTQIRGVIGIIAAKTGLVIGIAHLMQVIGPLCLDDYIKNRTLHGSQSLKEIDLPYPKTYAPVLARCMPPNPPIAYKHPQGAVIWVKL